MLLDPLTERRSKHPLGKTQVRFAESASDILGISGRPQDGHLMRWLIIALLVSTVALLAVSAGAARHIWQAHKRRSQKPISAGKHKDAETEEAP